MYKFLYFKFHFFKGDENWILAEVVSYNASSAKYEVDDIDEEQKDRHTLSRRRVIPLTTMRASPETNPEALYTPGATVMAIYPQTTCFYKGVIKDQPGGAAEVHFNFQLTTLQVSYYWVIRSKL